MPSAGAPAAAAAPMHEHKRFLTVLPDDDSLAIANNSGNNIQIISANGALRRNLGTRGEEPGQFLGPAGLACDGEHLYVTDWIHRVQKNQRKRVQQRTGGIRRVRVVPETKEQRKDQSQRQMGQRCMARHQRRIQ